MIVTTIAKVKIEAVARNQTTVAHGVGGHKDVTGMATTKEKVKAMAVNVATAASRADAAALSHGDAAAAVVTAGVVNPAPETNSAEAVNRVADADTAEVDHAADIRPARAAIIKAAAGKITAATAAAIGKVNETTSRIATRGTAVTWVATDKATTKS